MISFLYALMKVDAEILLSHSSFHERALIRKIEKRWLLSKEYKRLARSKAEGEGEGGSLEKEGGSRNQLNCYQGEYEKEEGFSFYCVCRETSGESERLFVVLRLVNILQITPIHSIFFSLSPKFHI